MATLYRKYRPQNFKELVGQNHIKITLQHEIESNKIAHAYLFCGPRAVGKTTIARLFSKSINCLNRKEGDHEPCNVCDSCNDINSAKSLDIFEVDAASHTGVDNVRDNIINASRTTPTRSKYKVFIIDEVHMLSISAFNALLKIMEEPPEYVVFILCTTEVHKIPATIISRCQRFDFKRISINDTVKRLQIVVKNEDIVIDKKIIESIARQSEGYMRDALSLLGQVVAISGKEITQEEADLVIPRSDLQESIKLIEMLSKNETGQAIGLVNKLIDEGIDLKRFVIDVIELLRKVLMSKISPGLSAKLGLELGESLELEINKIIKGIDANKIILSINKLLEAKEKIKDSYIMQLPLEIAICEICLNQPSNSGMTESNPISPAPTSISNSKPQQSSPGQEPKQQNLQVNQTQQKYAQQAATSTPLTNIQKANVSIDQVINKWNEVLACVKKYNHSLTFILRACQPKSIEGNELTLLFKYQFHKDRVEDVNVKAIIEKVLIEVFGGTIMYNAIIDENLVVDTSNSNNSAETPQKTKEDIPREENIATDLNSNVSEVENNEEKEVNMMDNLLKTFGGKIVE